MRALCPLLYQDTRAKFVRRVKVCGCVGNVRHDFSLVAVAAVTAEVVVLRGIVCCPTGTEGTEDDVSN